MVKHKNFLFTSVGDNSKFDKLWINDNMTYDIYAAYYGNNPEYLKTLKSKLKCVFKKKGSKFQNLKFFFDHFKSTLYEYDRFFILDDDIIFNVNDINNMFKISREYNLDICALSFLDSGKISHDCTAHKPNILLSYTNFVEVNTPLFSRDALKNLLKVLDYNLIGWGIDYLYIYCNGIDKKIICNYSSG